MTQLKDFKSTFPRWTNNELRDLCSKLPEDGLDLLEKMLVYDPIERITCEEALNHPYFSSLDKSSFAGYDPTD